MIFGSSMDVNDIAEVTERGRDDRIECAIFFGWDQAPNCAKGGLILNMVRIKLHVCGLCGDLMLWDKIVKKISYLICVSSRTYRRQ